MAHVLLGWELGAGRGHAIRFARLADALRGAGHRVSFAVQRVDSLDAAVAGDSAVWQAPVTPRFLVGAARPNTGPPAGMADILARIGMDDPVLVAAMIRGWDQLLRAVAPDVAIGDFSPFLHLAARGRLPLLAVGTGFSLPPSGMPSFPALIERVAGVDQRALLGSINGGLRAAGRAPLATTPQVWAADRVLPATLAELDPYAGQRADPYVSAVTAGFAARAGGGDEVFVYGSERLTARAAIWRALVCSGLAIRVHVPGATAELRAALVEFGFDVEPEPLPFARIAERSRLLVSHGGHGFVSAGLHAGLPNVVFHQDLEKLLHGVAVARLGLGGYAALQSLNPERFGADLAKLHADEALAARARAAAKTFRARRQPPVEEAVVQAVAALA
jgi:hypothetical protein